MCEEEDISEIERMVLALRKGSGPLVGFLSEPEALRRMVACFAPFGKQARDDFYRDLREGADAYYPCDSE